MADNFVQRSSNNIALLKLEDSWPTGNPSIDIINLPKAEPNYGISYMVVGWGRMFKVRCGINPLAVIQLAPLSTGWSPDWQSSACFCEADGS